MQPMKFRVPRSRRPSSTAAHEKNLPRTDSFPELQSTNEGLTTLNDELQSRNLELRKLSDDMLNLFGSVDIPIIFLSADMRIRRFTPKAQKVLNLLRGDIGRSISDFKISELRMIELKQEINALLQQAGQPPRYRVETALPDHA